MNEVLTALADEQADLDALVSTLDDTGWDLVTPAEPWTIRDTIGHLAFFDEKAALSAGDADAFAEDVNTGLTAGLDAYMGQHLDKARAMSPSEVLSWWREARASMLEMLGACDPEQRLPWYGLPMKARSSAVARLMETWAHGQDVADALSLTRTPTDRLFHVAELGVKTFRFAFENRGLEVPEQRVRVALRGTTGNVKVWNDEFDDSVTGPVEEFCLVVTQRRHFDDTHLVVEGDLARRWMEIAQVFAGPPGPGRKPTPR